MTILWAGGEDTSFVLTAAGVSTTTAVFRSVYAREAVGATNAAITTNTWPMAFSLATPLWGPSSSFYVHGRHYAALASVGGITNATTASAILLAVADSSGVGRILVRGTGTAGQLKISTRNAAGTIVDLVTSAAGAYPAAVSGVPVAIDLFVNYAVSGQCILYCNGVNIADTGAGVNVTTDSVTSLAKAYYGAASYSTNTFAFWSECAIRTDSTLGMTLQTLPPVASGNTQSWTPNTVADVNPTTINDANFVATTSANALSEWTVATTLPTGSWAIAAVVQEARVSVGTSGPLHFEWLVRTVDGTDHVTGSVAPTTSFANYSGQVWPTNPQTGVAWVAGDLINAGIESLT